MGSNAERFINCYNVLDKSLRDIYNLKPNLTFSDVIRKSASVNSVIKNMRTILLTMAALETRLFTAALVVRSLQSRMMTWF